jgi:peptidoglycan/LPS O-acetylase OafA/YrhL
MKFAELMQGRTNNLNLIRLIASCAVALSHCYNFTGQLASEPLLKLTGTTTLGYLSVFVFFVISGALVAQSFDRTASVWHFIAARVLRLYPALLVTLLATAYVLGPMYTTLSLSDYFAHNEVRRYVEDNFLFKDHGGLPGVFAEAGGFTATVNGSLWSLQYEVYAYLLLFLCGISGLISNRAAFNTAAVLLFLLYSKEPMGFLLVPGSWNAVICVPLMGFLLGALVYVNRHHLACKLSFAVAGLVIYVLLRGHQWVHVVFVLTLGYAVLTLGFHPNLQLRIKLPNDYSYGIYLYAFPVQQAIMHSAPTQSALALFAMTMLATVPLAMLSWHLIEKPALKLKKYLKSRRTQTMPN